MKPSPADELDVKAAARVAGRTTETIRRWVWSGRLPARKRGNRLVMARKDVEALAGATERRPLSLAEWARLAERALRGRRGPRASASDLVIEERRRRLEEVGAHRGR
ncbi:MAG: helix-turn-helix domain-containing protein [Chloroflexi bacterium]|nr:MAG: helix-turn-helix domain-containing protein [Chloroflexota bacterium]TMD71775.1 MAG: helix-turn-helix domain-containing protein [Chloroflexota bacterium]